MSLKFCIIIESNSQNTFFAFVLYTNIAAVTSRENRVQSNLDYSDLDYPDFFSGPNLVVNISVLVTIKIRSDILFKTTALKGAVKCEGFLLSKSKSSARA